MHACHQNWVLFFKKEFDAHKYEGYQGFLKNLSVPKRGFIFPAHCYTKDTMRVKVLRNYFQGQVNNGGEGTAGGEGKEDNDKKATNY